MRTDVEPVLDLVNLSRPLDASRFMEHVAVFDEGQWSGFEQVLNVHRLQGLAWNRLANVPAGVIPEDLAARLRKAFHRNKLQAMKMVGEFRRLGHAFAEAGVETIPIKGVDLVQRVYPEPGLRMFEDMDLLVRREDVTRVTRVMRTLGYDLPKALLPASIVKAFHFHLPFFHAASGMVVEIHWQLADRHALAVPAEDWLWPEKKENDTYYRTLPPDVYACYLAVHISKHGYLNSRIAGHERVVELALHPWSDLRLAWFVDLALLMKVTGVTVEDILSVARSCRCERAVDEALRIGHALLGGFDTETAASPASPESILERRVKDRLVARMLADIETNKPLDGRVPWMLRINKRVHIRPVRLLNLRKSG